VTPLVLIIGRQACNLLETSRKVIKFSKGVPAKGPLMASRVSREIAKGAELRVVSWNLLRRVGAGIEDIARLVKSHHPDLLFLQEATEDVAALPSLVGGHFFRHAMDRRIYGLAAWSPQPFPQTTALRLPASVLPGRVPPRHAQLVQFGGISFANVHLSHGQFLNRWQLLHIASALEGPAAIIGDFNAVGPTLLPGLLPGFRDIGPRRRTHRSANIVNLRLDRCLARGVAAKGSKVLERGASDHHPIVLDLAMMSQSLERSALLAL
jgi:endonuclease/exonuclease/phosphatase family metal-dependent hydrolase